MKSAVTRKVLLLSRGFGFFFFSEKLYYFRECVGVPGNSARVNVDLNPVRTPVKLLCLQVNSFKQCWVSNWSR